MKEYKIDLSGYEGKVREVVSEAIQRHAFELGYEGWLYGGKIVQDTQVKFLYIKEDCFTIGFNADTHLEAPYTPISPADFLTLTPEDVKEAPKEPEFKPFDRVLVRDSDEDEWHIDFFERYYDKDAPYGNMCVSSRWRHCIPYEGNEHLLGTTEDVK